MPSFQDYQQQYAQQLIDAVNSVSSTSANTTATAATTDPNNTLLLPLLGICVRSIPYYGSLDWQASQRAGIANLLANQLPNGPIAPAPPTDKFPTAYSGYYTGYRDAFFGNLAPVYGMRALLPTMQPVWWSNYAIAVLTDALRSKCSLPINIQRVQNDLTTFDTALKPVLAQTYQLVFQSVFPASSTASSLLQGLGLGPAAVQLLAKVLTQGLLNNNLNPVLNGSNVDNSVTAAIFFLYNLWILVSVLDPTYNVDSLITTAKTGGLAVPDIVSVPKWRDGSYTDYYMQPVNGADIAGMAENLTSDMPQIEIISYGGTSVKKAQAISQGYAQSFCLWGAYNIYG